MKILTIILCVLLFNVYLTAIGAPLIRVDTSRIESVSMKSITKKYADIKSDNLVFDGIQYSMTAKGSESIRVTYKLPASTKQEDTSKGSVTNHITRVQTIDVTLSNDGKVTDISKGSATSYSFGTK